MNESACSDCRGLFLQLQQRVLIDEVGGGEALRLSFSSYLASCVNYTSICSASMVSVNGPSDNAEAESGRQGGLPAQMLGVSVAMPIVASCLLVLLVIWIWRRPRGHKRRTLWGRVKAPSASEDSTLVISDIENSTQLWEILDESVMDTAITLHHTCFREHIRQCVGYEASVEGDSFCICFHNASDASYFCVAVQAALMQLAWPEQLLSIPDCAAVWISHTPSKNAIPLGDHRVTSVTGSSNYTARHAGISYAGTDMLTADEKRDTQQQCIASSGAQTPKLGAVYDQTLHSDDFSSKLLRYDAMVSGPGGQECQAAEHGAGRGSFESMKMISEAQNTMPGRESMERNMLTRAVNGEQLIKARLRKSKEFSVTSQLEHSHSADDAAASQQHVCITMDSQPLDRSATQADLPTGPSLVERAKSLRHAVSQKLPSSTDSSVMCVEHSTPSAMTRSFIKPNIRKGPRRHSSRLQWADLVSSKSQLNSEAPPSSSEAPGEQVNKVTSHLSLMSEVTGHAMQPIQVLNINQLTLDTQLSITSPSAAGLPPIADSPSVSTDPCNVFAIHKGSVSGGSFHPPRDVLLSTAMAIPEAGSSTFTQLAADTHILDTQQSAADRFSHQSQTNTYGHHTSHNTSKSTPLNSACAGLVGTLSSSSLAKYQLESVIEVQNASARPSDTRQRQGLPYMLDGVAEGSLQGWSAHTKDNQQQQQQLTGSGWLHKLTTHMNSLAQRARELSETDVLSLKQARGIQVSQGGAPGKAKTKPDALQPGLQDTDSTAPGAAQSDPEDLTTSVGKSLQNRCFLVCEGDPGAKLVFRGLRVRIGCHSGLSPADCQFNKATGRMQYSSGRAYQTAKAVCDAACGGMVLLSEQCHSRLFVEEVQQKAMVFHMGDHRLKGDMAPMSIHQLVGRPWMERLPLLAPVRSHCALSLGALDAPAGFVTVCFMHVVGEATLQAWNQDVAAESLALFQLRAGALLHKHKGYMMEGANGFILASFSRVTSAVRWALQCVTDLKRADWPEELLSHELGEEMVTRVIDPTTGNVTESIMLRGLRIKAGLDCGRLRGEVNCITGRMTYRGRYMNRAARIAAAAGTGQVLVSADVNSTFTGSAGSHLYVISSMGFHRFKGVQEAVEVFDIQPSNNTLMTKRGSLALTRASQEYTILRKEFDANLINQSFHMSRVSKHQSRPSNLGPVRSRPASGASYSHGPSRATSFKEFGTSVRRSLLMLGLSGPSTAQPQAPRAQNQNTCTSATSCKSHLPGYDYSPRTSAQGVLAPKYSSIGSPGSSQARSGPHLSHNGVLTKGRRESTIMLPGQGQYEDPLDTDSGGSRRGHSHAGLIGDPGVQTVMTQTLRVHQGQGSHVIVVQPSLAPQTSTSGKWESAVHTIRYSQPGYPDSPGGMSSPGVLMQPLARGNSKGVSDSGVVPSLATKRSGGSGSLGSHGKGSMPSLAMLATEVAANPSSPKWLSGDGSAPGVLVNTGQALGSITREAIELGIAPAAIGSVDRSEEVAISTHQAHAQPANAFMIAASASDKDSNNRDSLSIPPTMHQPHAAGLSSAQSAAGKDNGAVKASTKLGGGSATVPTVSCNPSEMADRIDKDRHTLQHLGTFAMLLKGSASNPGGRHHGDGDGPVPTVTSPTFLLTSGRRGSTASVPDPNYHMLTSLPARKSLDSGKATGTAQESTGTHGATHFPFLNKPKAHKPRTPTATAEAGNLLIVHGDSTDEDADDDGDDGRAGYGVGEGGDEQGHGTHGTGGEGGKDNRVTRFGRVLRQASMINLKRMTRSIAGSVHDRPDKEDEGEDDNR